MQALASKPERPEASKQVRADNVSELSLFAEKVLSKIGDLSAAQKEATSQLSGRLKAVEDRMGEARAEARSAQESGTKLEGRISSIETEVKLGKEQDGARERKIETLQKENTKLREEFSAFRGRMYGMAAGISGLIGVISFAANYLAGK